MATTKAALVSGKDLTAAVNRAVKLAAARHQATVSEANVILNWELIGRTIKERALADAFADDVSAELGKAGIPVVAGTARFGKVILCGFFEKARLPQMRGF